MSDENTVRDDTEAPAPPAQIEANRRRQLRAAAAAEARYILSFRAG